MQNNSISGNNRGPMSSENDLFEHLGKIQGTLEAIEKNQNEIRNDMRENNKLLREGIEKVDCKLEEHVKTTSGIKVALSSSGIGGLIGGIAGAFATFFK